MHRCCRRYTTYRQNGRVVAIFPRTVRFCNQIYSGRPTGLLRQRTSVRFNTRYRTPNTALNQPVRAAVHAEGRFRRWPSSARVRPEGMTVTRVGPQPRRRGAFRASLSRRSPRTGRWNTHGAKPQAVATAAAAENRFGFLYGVFVLINPSDCDGGGAGGHRGVKRTSARSSYTVEI